MFVDTSLWIGLFSARDQHHSEADRLMRQAVRKGVTFQTTNLVVSEMHKLLFFRGGARAALAAIRHVEASDRVRVEFATSEHHRAAVDWLERLGGQPVSYTDAVSFAVMESAGCAAVLGFNGDFESAGFERWRG